MKRAFLVMLAVTAVVAKSASAADMPVKAPVKVPPVEIYDWSGIYIGAGLGGGWTEPHRFYPNLPEVGIPPTTFASHGTDTVYDIFGGAQWQFGQWLVGVEGDYIAGINQMKSSVSVSPPEPFTHLASTTKVTDLWMLGPRLGVAWNRFMMYGTGGYAAARLSGSYSCADTGIPVLPGPGACSAVFGPVRNLDFGGTTWNDGWYLGAGVEFMAFRTAVSDIILGAEYRHFQVDSKLAFVCDFAHCGPTTHQDFFQDARGDMLSARLTIKTNGWGIWTGRP